MRFDIKRGLALIAVTCAIFIACDSDSSSSTGPSGDLVGMVKFSYSGAGLSGTFEAKGDLKNGMPTSTSAAFATTSEEPGEEAAAIFASVLSSDKSYFDSFWAILSEETTGTYSVGLNCQPVPGTTRCAFIQVEFEVPMDEDDDGAFFTMVSGELKVTSADDGRLEGTFSGSARAGWGEGAEVLEIKDGTFDVPLIDASEIPGLKNLNPGSARKLGERDL